LIKQFLSESILLCIIAVIISIMLVEIVLPYFNNLTDKELSLNLSENVFVIPGLIIFTLFLGIAAGLYPSLLLASFKPVLVLKSKAAVHSKKGSLRRSLVIFQFSTSVVLFVGTLVIYNQMQYIKNKNLGFNKDHVLVIKNINDLGTKQSTFANAIRENVNVQDVSLSFGLPDYNLTANIYKKKGENNPYTLVTLPVDYNYLSTYTLKMNEGRYFSKNISSDTLAIILNEAAVKKLNIKNPLNSEQLTSLENENNVSSLKIIGIVKDFHLQTLKDEIRPAALILLNTPEADFLSVKISSNDIQKTIKYLSDKWKEFGQIKPMEYSFFDDNFNELYKSEIQSEKVFTIFAVLAIIIACLGLFGLTAFTAEQRKKEIGIRKVLGATVTNIVAMLSKEFLILVAVANVIAWPISYYMMHKWLEDFVYKIEMDIGVFLIAGLAVLLIALITILFQAINAAISNPVKSLRYE
jgi:putative ABC transport system permease protein